jgi:hypothetical protein
MTDQLDSKWLSDKVDNIIPSVEVIEEWWNLRIDGDLLTYIPRLLIVIQKYNELKWIWKCIAIDEFIKWQNNDNFRNEYEHLTHNKILLCEIDKVFASYILMKKNGLQILPHITEVEWHSLDNDWYVAWTLNDKRYSFSLRNTSFNELWELYLSYLKEKDWLKSYKWDDVNSLQRVLWILTRAVEWVVDDYTINAPEVQEIIKWISEKSRILVERQAWSNHEKSE